MVELAPGASVALGILVGLVSTCVQSIGLTQQRKSHLLEEQKQEDDVHHVSRPAYRRRRWQVGMLMFLVSNIVGSSIQITTLPLPVLSTLQASGLVFNTICATVVLGEPFTRYSLVGTVLVASGAVFIGIFGSVTEPSHNLTQLLILFGRREFLIWLCGTLFVVAGIMLGMFALKRIHPRQTHRVRLLRGMSYGAISGVLSAHTLLLAKSAVELLVRSIFDHVNQFNRWQAWMILLGLVVLALLQLYYLHRGLKLVSTSVLYPFVFCIYNIIAIIDGLVYFDQSSRLSITHAVLIAVGTIVLLGGVFALSWRLQADDDLPGPVVGDMRTKTGIPPPRTILQPGMGLAEEPEEMDNETDADTPLLLPVNDVEALHSAKHTPTTETTPLLRDKARTARSMSLRQSRAPALRNPKGRRMTALQEADRSDVWDELNDRPTSRRFSGEQSPHSVRSPKGARSSHGRSVSGPRKSKTLPLDQRKSSSSQNLAQLPWRRSDTLSKNRSLSHDMMSPPPMDGLIDGEETEGDGEAGRRRGSMSRPSTAGGDQETRPGWFKLKWWRKRWRAEDDEIGGGSGGGHGQA